MKYSFFFHFNKPESRKRGRPIISLHHRGECLLVENLVCGVPTRGRANKRQPIFVMTGRAASVVVKDNVAYIT